MFIRSFSLKPVRFQALGLVLPAALALAAPANADIITSHGISTFGELK